MENTNINSYLKRVTLFLEDESWEEADTYCEKVLDIDPECAEAYLGKLLSELKLHSIDELSQIDKKLNENKNYKKILRYGDETLCNKLLEIEKTISKNQEINAEKQKKESIYNEVSACESSNDEEIILSCIQKLESISDYKDSDEKAEQFKTKYNEIIYSKAIEIMNKATDKNGYEQAAAYFRKIENYKDSALKIQECIDSDFEIIYKNAVNLHNLAINEADYEKAIKEFERLGNYKDSNARCEQCHNSIREMNYIASTQKREKKRKKTIIIISSVIAVIIAAALVFFFGFLKPKMDKYKEANRLYNEAETISTSTDFAESCFDEGNSLRDEYFELYEQGKYDEADVKYDECIAKFNTAEASFNNNENKCKEASDKYAQAEKLFGELGDYRDSKEKQAYSSERRKENDYDEASAIFNQGNCLYNIGEYEKAREKYANANIIWTTLGDYLDSASYTKYMKAHIAECDYDYETARTIYKELGDFQNSREYYDNLNNMQ